MSFFQINVFQFFSTGDQLAFVCNQLAEKRWHRGEISLKYLECQKYLTCYVICDLRGQ